MHDAWNGVRSDNQTDFVLRMLEAHNRVRESAGQPPLVWDHDLAAHARDWSDTISVNNSFQHSEDEDAPEEGENLWSGTSGAYSLEDMIGHFTEEKKLYRRGTFPNVSSTGDVSDVGHYTQMIWPDTQRVGCAISSAKGHDWLVCRYYPAGNVIGDRMP